MHEIIFLQIGILLAITVALAFIARYLRQPLMIAYIIAGIFCGPIFFDLINGSRDTLGTFAQLGVVLLLFVIGLSLNLNYLKKIGRVAIVTGLGQIIFTLSIGFIILAALGFSPVSAAYLATAITFSSTIIITKLLSDKRDTEKIYGRYTIGLMIVQDIIAVLILVGLGTIDQSHGALASFAFLLMKGLLAISLFVFVSRYFLNTILEKVSETGEFLFIFTVAWCFGIAGFVHWLGFSFEIGAITAGIMLGSSPFQTEIASRIKPLRDFFIILFFILLGSQMGISNFANIIIPGIILSIFILAGNPLILYLLFRFFKFTRKNSFLAGLTAAQVSEFGFVLLFTGNRLGHIQESELSIFTIVALITIFSSSYLISHNNKVYNLALPFLEIFGRDRRRQREQRMKESYEVWILGCHRMGWRACQALIKKGVGFAVVDINSATIAKLEKQGIPALFGDVADIEFLETLPLKKARLLILTAPDPEDQKTLVSYVSRFKKPPEIISNLHHYKHFEELYSMGTSYVIMPHLLGGQWIADILKKYPWSKKTLHKLRKQQIGQIHVDF